LNKVILGLGNPGAQYAKTRHNIGFRVLDCMADQLHLEWRPSQFKGYTAEGQIGEQRFMLLKPTTFMNLSGQSAQAILQWYKLPIQALLVVADDFALPLGKIRIRQKGSSGGHHGLDSIIQYIGTIDFLRLRIGIGDPNQNTTSFVLSKFSETEEAIIANSIVSASEAILAWLQDRDLNWIMNHYHCLST